MFDLEFEIHDALAKFDKPVSWKEIKQALFESSGFDITPISLHYHLKKLVQNGEVEKLTIGEEIYYILENEPR